MGKQKKKNRGGGGTKMKAKLGKKRNFKSKDRQQRSEPVVMESEKVKVTNPFEIRMHRPKQDNLGRRARHEKGLPGVSRSKAIEKRKDTLLKEYKMRSKTNVIVDRRIGEKVKNMPEEEKIARRSVMEKRRQYKQKSIFNLPSTDDILTHKGQLLMDIDRYEDPRDESDSEDERLNEEFVSDAHFAGDFLKFKDKPDGDDTELGSDQHKSRKDIIGELILQSKQRKMEKAKEADETYELVSKLDQEFKSPDFRNLLNFVKKGVNEHETVEQPPKKEDYDKLVRELHFEAKTGSASNRLKTEEEVQEDELKKLKRLEKERLKRMKHQDPTVETHRSADDLGDDFEEDEDVPVVSYSKKDGKLNLEENESEEEEEEGQDEEEEDGEESDDDSDAFSDLQSDGEEDDEADVDDDSKLQASESDQVAISTFDDIPFTLVLPKSYEAFTRLMIKYKAKITDRERYKIVLERLVKYSLLAEKQRLPELFIYIFQFIIDGVDKAGVLTDTIQASILVSSGHLHTLLLTSTAACVDMMESGLLPNFVCSGKRNKLTLSKIVLYQICSKIFCVTDFCHRVLSPMKVNILELVNSTCSNYMSLLKMLALADIIYDVSKESKRYSPEVIKLLFDILEAVALPKEKLVSKRRRFEFLKVESLLEDSKWAEESDPHPLLKEKDDECGPPTKNQVLSLLLRVFDLLNNFITIQHKTRPFNNLIFKSIKTQLVVLRLKWEDCRFHKELYSRRIQKEGVTPAQGEVVQDEIPACTLERPKMLKLYEPLIEENFDGNRRKKLKRKGMTQEAAKLNHKVKKEMKSAYREMLKDNAFLAKQQMKEQSMKDAERNRRVKEILGGLANQEGDYRKIKRHKK